MAKYLNVDELAPEQRVLKLRGKEYPMKEMSMEELITTIRETEQLAEKKGKVTVSEQMEMMVQTVQRAFPSCPKGVLMSLSVAQLAAIIDFAQKDFNKQAEGGEEKKGQD